MKGDKIREAMIARLATNHLKDIYECLDSNGGKMNLPTNTVDEYMLWDKLKEDPTLKISERFPLCEGGTEIVVIERIN